MDEPTNEYAPEDARATITNSTAGETVYFRAAGFEFSIPGTAINI